VENYSKTVTHGENGMLADNNTDSWYSCLKQLADSADLRKSLSEKAYKLVNDNYSMEKNSQIWESYYRSLLEDNNA
jgi:glycosyltransferase involved in cell wall biosynthesis